MPKRLSNRLHLSVIFAIVIAISLMFADISCADNSRQVMLAFDLSKGMKSKPMDSAGLKRVRDYVLSILYDQIPTQINKNDQVLTAPSDLKATGPLYRKGDVFTYFDFSDSISYEYRQVTKYVDRKDLSRKLPERFRGSESSPAQADTGIFRNLNPAVDETYVVRVSLQNGKGAVTKPSAELAAYNAKCGLKPVYAILVQKRVKIEVFSASCEGPAPNLFALAPPQSGDLPNNVLCFDKTSGKAKLKKGYKIVSTGDAKAGDIEKIEAILAKKGGGESYVSTLARGNIKLPFDLGDLNLDSKFVSPDYYISLEIHQRAANRRSNTEIFTIPGLQLAVECTAAAPEMCISSDGDCGKPLTEPVKLKFKDNSFQSGNLAINVKNPADRKRVDLQDCVLSFVSGKPAEKSILKGSALPGEFKAEFSTKDLAGVPLDKPLKGSLKARYVIKGVSGAKAAEFPVSFVFEVPEFSKSSLRVKSAGEENKLVFKEGDEGFTAEKTGIQIADPTISKLYDLKKIRFVAEPGVEWQKEPKTFAELEDFLIALDKDKSDRIKSDQPKSGKLEITYSLVGSTEDKKLEIEIPATFEAKPAPEKAEVKPTPAETKPPEAKSEVKPPAEKPEVKPPAEKAEVKPKPAETPADENARGHSGGHPAVKKTPTEPQPAGKRRAPAPSEEKKQAKFVLADSKSKKPIQKIQAKWVNGRLQVDNLNVSAETADPKLQVREAAVTIPGIFSERKQLEQLPAPLPITVGQVESNKINPGELPAEVEVFYEYDGSKGAEKLAYTIVVPQLPPPFIITDKAGKPLNRLDLKLVDDKWSADNVYVKIKEKPSPDRGVQLKGVSLQVDAAKPKKFPGAPKLTEAPVPLKIQFTSEDLEGARKGSEDRPMILRLDYQYAGGKLLVQEVKLKGVAPSSGLLDSIADTTGLPDWGVYGILGALGLVLLGVVGLIAGKIFGGKKPVKFRVMVGDELDQECGPFVIKSGEKVGLSAQPQWVQCCEKLDSTDSFIINEKGKLYLNRAGAIKGERLEPDKTYIIPSESGGDLQIAIVTEPLKSKEPKKKEDDTWKDKEKKEEKKEVKTEEPAKETPPPKDTKPVKETQKPTQAPKKEEEDEDDIQITLD